MVITVSMLRNPVYIDVLLMMFSVSNLIVFVTMKPQIIWDEMYNS